MDNKELDIWLAENVMGWRSHKLSPKVWIDDIIKYTIPKSEWRPTQNIDQAVMALEKLFEGKKWDFELFYSSSESFSDKEKDHFYLAGIYKGLGDDLAKSANIPSRAICLAMKEAMK